MAENHPVGFQWVMEAKERGAKLIHVDPRFTRTSAMADLHVPLRAGSDIAFLGGIVNYILEHGREFRDYVVPYTNAAVIINEDFADTEDLDGMFSGWDAEAGAYDPASWQYEGMTSKSAAGGRAQAGERGGGEQSHGAHGAGLTSGHPPSTDPTLEHPRCVFQLLKRHFSRYTPEMVERVCGVPADQLTEVAETLCRNSGRERTSAIAYAVGWTQHTVGAQYIRTAAIIQLLLGNMGRPGGGILALRGHASIQGSTDIPTLYNLLPGYLPMPQAEGHETLDAYIEEHRPPAGFWGNTSAYVVSLLKAWFGDAATAENDYCFGHLPRLTGDHSHYATSFEMRDGKVDGYFVMGQNPVVGTANSKLHRLALTELKWLVVRDFTENETAAFWYDSPEIDAGENSPESIGTEVFFMPAAAHTEKDGAFTNTQRLLQWHHQAVEPKGDCRSELWFMYHLGRRVREKLADSHEPRDRPVLDLTWDYPTKGPREEPDAEAVLKEISGYRIADRGALSGYMELSDDGSTASGCWIYCGAYADEVNQTARRKPGQDQTWIAPEWAWAWPLNRRILYNRASADPEGKPWSERKRLVWWDEEAERWTGHDIPDFEATKHPGYVPPDGAEAQDALRGDDPFVMQADGVGWLYVPSGLQDGPFPTHYEPQESPLVNPLYAQQVNPTREQFGRPDNAYNPVADQLGAEAFPYVMTTYRLTEHHTAGGMSRTLPFLAELQPEMFCEVSPELAAERELEHGGWATVVTMRQAIEARVLVTERMAPQTIDGQRIHTVGLPYHWGARGEVTGDSANELLSIVLDANTHIGEYKAATCDIRPGRRPRGQARLDLVDGYRAQTAERTGPE